MPREQLAADGLDACEVRIGRLPDTRGDSPRETVHPGVPTLLVGPQQA
jgi:hypothetical protein